MKTMTRNLIRQIQTRLKSNLTGKAEFSTEDAVIDYVIQQFYEDLRRQRKI